MEKKLSACSASDCKEGGKASLLNILSLQVTKFLGQKYCNFNPHNCKEGGKASLLNIFK